MRKRRFGPAIAGPLVAAAALANGGISAAAGLPGAPRDGVHESCSQVHELRFVCGTEHPEDMARIPGTRWVIVSEFERSGGLKLLDARARRLERLHFESPRNVAGSKFGGAVNCPGPPNEQTLDTQGLSLRVQGKGHYVLYAVNHGGRQSIEIFSVSMRGHVPVGRWQGCVLMPPGDGANAVSSFPNGTIIATVLTLPGETKADFVRGKSTGGVFEWRPGTRHFHLLRGTSLPGNNGLAASPNGRVFYVVAFGLHAIFMYSSEDTDKPLRWATAPGFMPDNIHWYGGRLIAAGMTYDEPACGGIRKVIDGRADPMRCHRGYVVAAVNPKTLRFSILAYGEPNPAFNGATTGLIIDNRLWISSYQADRLAYRWLPGRGSSGWVHSCRKNRAKKD